MQAKPQGKYDPMWEALKSQGVIRVVVYKEADRSRLMRGISQIKNLDVEWKSKSYTNLCQRLKPVEIEETSDGGILLEVSLVAGAKYRNSII